MGPERSSSECQHFPCSGGKAERNLVARTARAILPEPPLADPNLSPFIWSVADSTRGATNQDSGLTQMIRIQSALPPLSVQREIVKSLYAATRRPIAMIAEGNKTRFLGRICG